MADRLTELERLAKLRDARALTLTEYEIEKRRILSTLEPHRRTGGRKVVVFFFIFLAASAAAIGWTLLGGYRDPLPTSTPRTMSQSPQQTRSVLPAPRSPPKEEAGTIAGELSYPSDYIPADMQVCAVNVASRHEICGGTRTERPDGTFYELQVPPGRYTVYANTKAAPSEKAFFTEAVPCGLTVECDSAEPIVVRVMADRVTSGVDPGDWYHGS